MVYGADAMVALQAWISGAVDSFTGHEAQWNPCVTHRRCLSPHVSMDPNLDQGTGFGTRVAGDGTLPGGSSFNGRTGISVDLSLSGGVYQLFSFWAVLF